MKHLVFTEVHRYLTNLCAIYTRVGFFHTAILSYRVIKTRLLGYPYDISIEPAGFCNLKCPMCIQARSMTDIERERKLLSFQDFKKVIDDIKGFAVSVSLFYAGEPLLNKDLFRMIEYATQHRILTYISTNGVLLANQEVRAKLLRSGLFKLHISFDGASAEVYEKHRVGANFEEVKESIRLFVKERGSAKLPIIAMQTIVDKSTLPQVSNYILLAKELGVDKAFMTNMHIDQYRQSASREMLDDLIVGGKYSRYERIEDGRAIPKKDYSKCPILNSLYILTDGTVVHCCYDYEGKYTFGNAFETDLKKIWKEPKYIKWRKEWAGPMKLPLCSSCTITAAGSWNTIYEAN